jgi:hypothetical protein
MQSIDCVFMGIVFAVKPRVRFSSAILQGDSTSAEIIEMGVKDDEGAPDYSPSA